MEPIDIKVDFLDNFWPSKNATSIGSIDIDMYELARKLNSPVLSEGENRAIIVWLEKIGLVAFFCEPLSYLGDTKYGLIEIYVDYETELQLASQEIDGFLGGRVQVCWPPGKV